uniref:Protein kinase domain-containing protein n=1 Tax=Macrostomum lignano TaxID=282301 RepID=A0A1I8IKE7_9PLAT
PRKHWVSLAQQPWERRGREGKSGTKDPLPRAGRAIDAGGPINCRARPTVSCRPVNSGGSQDGGGKAGEASAKDSAVLTILAASSRHSQTLTAAPLSLRSSCLASLPRLPCSRTTTGRPGRRRCSAETRPSATTSQRTMPPKMFTSAAVTRPSEPMMSSACATCLAVTVPPTSRKLAGSPPCSLTMSMVAMARPAPFTRQPMSPSMPTYFRPQPAAVASRGSSWAQSRALQSSGWRKRAFESTLSLQSRHSTAALLLTAVSSGQCKRRLTLAVRVHSRRVHLQQRGVRSAEHPAELLSESRRGLRLPAGQPQHPLRHLGRARPGQRRLRAQRPGHHAGRRLLDAGAAEPSGHKDRAAAAPRIHGNRQVELAHRLGRLHHKQAVAGPALRTRLPGAQPVAQHPLRQQPRFIRPSRQTDAAAGQAAAPLAAGPPACQHLRLQHHLRPAAVFHIHLDSLGHAAGADADNQQTEDQQQPHQQEVHPGWRGRHLPHHVAQTLRRGGLEGGLHDVHALLEAVAAALGDHLVGLAVLEQADCAGHLPAVAQRHAAAQVADLEGAGLVQHRVHVDVGAHVLEQQQHLVTAGRVLLGDFVLGGGPLQALGDAQQAAAGARLRLGVRGLLLAELLHHRLAGAGQARLQPVVHVVLEQDVTQVAVAALPQRLLALGADAAQALHHRVLQLVLRGLEPVVPSRLQLLGAVPGDADAECSLGDVAPAGPLKLRVELIVGLLHAQPLVDDPAAALVKVIVVHSLAQAGEQLGGVAGLLGAVLADHGPAALHQPGIVGMSICIFCRRNTTRWQRGLRLRTLSFRQASGSAASLQTLSRSALQARWSRGSRSTDWPRCSISKVSLARHLAGTRWVCSVRVSLRTISDRQRTASFLVATPGHWPVMVGPQACEKAYEKLTSSRAMSWWCATPARHFSGMSGCFSSRMRHSMVESGRADSESLLQWAWAKGRQLRTMMASGLSRMSRLAAAVSSRTAALQDSASSGKLSCRQRNSLPVPESFMHLLDRSVMQGPYSRGSSLTRLARSSRLRISSLLQSCGTLLRDHSGGLVALVAVSLEPVLAGVAERGGRLPAGPVQPVVELEVAVLEVLQLSEAVGALAANRLGLVGNEGLQADVAILVLRAGALRVQLAATALGQHRVHLQVPGWHGNPQQLGDGGAAFGHAVGVRGLLHSAHDAVQQLLVVDGLLLAAVLNLRSGSSSGSDRYSARTCGFPSRWLAWPPRTNLEHLALALGVHSFCALGHDGVLQAQQRPHHPVLLGVILAAHVAFVLLQVVLAGLGEPSYCISECTRCSSFLQPPDSESGACRPRQLNTRPSPELSEAEQLVAAGLAEVAGPAAQAGDGLALQGCGPTWLFGRLFSTSSASVEGWVPRRPQRSRCTSSEQALAKGRTSRKSLNTMGSRRLSRATQSGDRTLRLFSIRQETRRPWPGCRPLQSLRRCRSSWQAPLAAKSNLTLWVRLNFSCQISCWQAEGTRSATDWSRCRQSSTAKLLSSTERLHSKRTVAAHASESDSSCFGHGDRRGDAAAGAAGAAGAESTASLIFGRAGGGFSDGFSSLRLQSGKNDS